MMNSFDHFTERFSKLMDTPIGQLVNVILIASLEQCAKDRSILGEEHVKVLFLTQEETALLAFVQEAGGIGMGFPIPRLPAEEMQSIGALLQCAVQGPYLRASDMAPAQAAGWLPSTLLCPNCGEQYKTYLDLWGHMLIDHGLVKNPFNERAALLEPLL